jgi:uncharacterized protein YceH (UPF0502 family)
VRHTSVNSIQISSYPTDLKMTDRTQNLAAIMNHARVRKIIAKMTVAFERYFGNFAIGTMKVFPNMLLVSRLTRRGSSTPVSMVARAISVAS